MFRKKKFQRRGKRNKLVINPENSWFEINVIDKNIRERKEMEERIGLTRIVQELRNSADYVEDKVNHNSSEESFAFNLNDNQ